MLFDEPRFAPTGSDRLIVVILPPPSVARDLNEVGIGLRENHLLRGNSRPISHLHVTMFHVGDFAGLREEVVAAARRACAAAAKMSRRFLLKMDRASCNGKRWRGNPLVLTGKEKNTFLTQLYQKLVLQFLREDFKDQRKRFNPHVTLAYVDGVMSSEVLPPVSWMAEDIVLIHSLVGKTQYIELGRWKLGA